MTTEVTSARSGLGTAAVANLVGGALGAMVNLVLAALVGRHLGTEGSGVYFLVVAVFLIVANSAELGADTGLVRFVAATRALGRPEDTTQIVRTAVVPVLVGGAVVVALGIPLALAVAPSGLSSVVVVAAVPLTVLASLTALALGITRGAGDPLAFPLVQNILLPAGRMVAVGVAVLAGWGVSEVVAAWLLPVPLVLVVAAALAARHVTGGARPEGRSRTAYPGFWRFSAARGATACVEIVLEWVDVVIVGVFASPAEAGVYAVVTRCARAGEVVQQAARIAVGPAISAASARGDHALVGRLYGVVTAAMVWAAWPFYAVLAVFAEPVLGIFGDGFESGAPSLRVLAAAMAVATAAGAVQSVLLMAGRSSWQLADKTGALALDVVLLLVLVPHWGIEGAAIAWAVTIVVDTAVVGYQVQVLMGVRPPWGPILWAAALPVVMVLVPSVLVASTWGTGVSVAAATTAALAVVYLAAGALLRRRLGLLDLVRLRGA